MTLRVVDSHTEGEPTRLVVEGLPDLQGTVLEKRLALERDHDWVRTMVCLEPRGSEIVVGAALFPPSEPGCLADVVYFDNAAYIGMCGHGTIGVMATLAWLGRIEPGRYHINTVAGIVATEVLDHHKVRIENVPAFRESKDVVLQVEGTGQVVGDIAYGGNWFFLIREPRMDVTAQNIPALMAITTKVMDALWEAGVRGRGGARIDHVIAFGRPELPDSDSKNFVLCPGKEYDRSPCGTGTSAKMACLFDDGLLAEKQVWTQESILGSVFRGWVTVKDKFIVPTIEGTAFVTGDSHLFADPQDPYRYGVVLGT